MLIHFFYNGSLSRIHIDTFRKRWTCKSTQFETIPSQTKVIKSSTYFDCSIRVSRFDLRSVHARNRTAPSSDRIEIGSDATYKRSKKSKETNNNKRKNPESRSWFHGLREPSTRSSEVGLLLWRARENKKCTATVRFNTLRLHRCISILGMIHRLLEVCSTWQTSRRTNNLELDPGNMPRNLDSIRVHGYCIITRFTWWSKDPSDIDC